MQMKQATNLTRPDIRQRQRGRISNRRPFQIILILIAMTIFGLAFTLAAQAGQRPNAVTNQAGPGFTFQGHLQDNGSPVSGSCDIRAGLWDAVSGGTQAGSNQTVSNVGVVDGRFTITLNENSEFGPEAFTGQERWLQIAVRCPAGSGSYNTLQPRQPLTATPYAQSLLPGAVISGSVGGPTNAMLSLSNFDPNGVGLRIFDASLDGLFIDRAGRDGVHVGDTVDDGFFVCNAGGLLLNCIPSTSRNGVEVGIAAESGLRVTYAGTNGVEVITANTNGIKIDNAHVGVSINNPTKYGLYVADVITSGVWIENADYDGLVINSTLYGNGVLVDNAALNGVAVRDSTNAFWTRFPTADGLYVQSAGFNGVDVTGGNLAGYFGGAVQVTGGCTGCLLANFGVNTGPTPLEPGDVVVLTGSQISRVDSTPLLLEVARAEGEGAVVGVVMGRAEAVTVEHPRENEIGRRLIPREGTAEAGDYVTIVTSGLAPVRLDGLSSPLTIGQRLTAAANGAARPLQTVEVDGVSLNESAPILGIALETADTDNDGLIWVMVNPM